MSKFIILFFILCIISLVYLGYSRGKLNSDKQYLQHDAKLYHYVQVTQKALEIYFRQFQTLPDTLDMLQEMIIKNKSDRTEYLDFLADFNTYNLDYDRISETSFRLCAHFYKNHSDQELSHTPDRFARFKNKKELYKKGRNCFTTQL